MSLRAGYNFVLILLVMGSCTYNEGPQSPAGSLDTDALRKKCDHLDAEIWRQFANNPDSAENLLISSMDSFDLWNLPHKKVYSELQLCELYQYRKPNRVKALERLERALKLMMAGQEPLPDSTYLFIDIGNVFFGLEMYLHAMSFYRIQYDIVRNSTYWHRKMLAAQNIALVWSELHQSDSAIWYLRFADCCICDRADITRANNNFLLQLQLLKKPGFSDREKLLDTAFKIMFRFRKSRLANPETKTARLEAHWYENMAEIHHARFLAYFQARNFAEAGIYLDSAIYYAKTAQSATLPVFYFIDKVKLSGKTAHSREMIQYAHLADSTISLCTDLSRKRSLYDTLSAALHACGQENLSGNCREHIQSLSDTLNRIREVSAPKIASVMQLSVVVLSRYLFGVHQREIQKTGVIRSQQRILLIALTFMALVTIFMVVFFYQKNRIHKAYKATVYQFNQRIQEENRSIARKSTSDGPVDFPEHKLKVMMQQEKPWLDNELTLQGLADMIGTNRTYLSQFLNSTLHTDFLTYINEYRVREVCRLLVSREYDHLKIDSLSQIAGFKSKASFYAAFVKLTGMTPAVYKKINSQNVLN